jgi:hypothetical protein
MLGVVRTVAALALAAAALAALPATARAGDGFVVGVADDDLKYDSARAAGAVRSLGARAVRVTVLWSRGATELGWTDRVWLDRAVAAAGSDIRIVLSVYGVSGAHAPLDEAGRDQYCSFVRSTLAPYPQIRDVVVWNEVNKSFFWQPQFNGDGTSAAPAAYGALLARCWDVLHAFRPEVNLLTSTSSKGNDNPSAVSNVSHSPGNFIRRLGQAYRASGRTAPIFDTVGHHPYGEHSAERPWRRHPLSATIGQGDWDKLTQAYHDAFAGTGQPNPGRCAGGRCSSIWYMEVGYQTTPDPEKAWLYRGAENTEHPLPAAAGGDPPGSSPDEKSLAPDQATQLTDAVRLAYCQPYVGAYFNFLLRDESDLARWQSGIFHPDWTPKASLGALAAVVAEANARRVDCSALKALGVVGGGAPPPGAGGAGAGGGGTGAAPAAALALQALFPAPRTDVPVLRVIWPAARRFNWRHDQWRFRVSAGEHATYRAVLYQVAVRQPSGRVVSVRPRPVRVATGSLKLGHLSFVNFRRGRLSHGARYRMEIVLTARESPARTTRRVSPLLEVTPPARRTAASR